MKLLEQLYSISSPSTKEKKMRSFLINKIRSIKDAKYSIDAIGNIYITKGKGESFPCLAAHIDEVHLSHSQDYEIVNHNNEIIFGYDTKERRFQGIGADDKNGIWVCLKCLELFPLLKCVFFVQEEIGCIGSQEADMTFFRDCRFVVQCDRKGNQDIITKINNTSICSLTFLKQISPSLFGYNQNHGLSTDVYQLKLNGLGISCINLSCGYYYPHSEHEMTNIADLNKCLDYVQYIIANCTDIYPHKLSSNYFRSRSIYLPYAINNYWDDAYLALKKDSKKRR